MSKYSNQEKDNNKDNLIYFQGLLSSDELYDWIAGKILFDFGKTIESDKRKGTYNCIFITETDFIEKKENTRTQDMFPYEKLNIKASPALLRRYTYNNFAKYHQIYPYEEIINSSSKLNHHVVESTIEKTDDGGYLLNMIYRIDD